MLPRGRLLPVFFFCVWFGLGFSVLFCLVLDAPSGSLSPCSIFEACQDVLSSQFSVQLSKYCPLFISHLLPSSPDCLKLRLALCHTNLLQISALSILTQQHPNGCSPLGFPSTRLHSRPSFWAVIFNMLRASDFSLLHRHRS